MNEIITDIQVQLHGQWMNARFSSDIQWKNGLKKTLNTFGPLLLSLLIVNVKELRKKKATFDNKLDKLFDILYCQHNNECT